MEQRRRDELGLVDLLGVPLETLVYYSTKANQAETYYKFELDKPQNGRIAKVRTITVPTKELDYIQRKILKHIIRPLDPIVHERATAYKLNTGRNPYKVASIKANSCYHLGREVLVTLDIDDFFGSITRNHLIEVFMRRGGWCMKASHILAGICLRFNHLPQGASTSPALSNLVCLPLDEQLYQFSRSMGISYTRYSDDLSFSFDDTYQVGEIIAYVEETLKANRFSLNPLKTKVTFQSGRQQVCGLVVNGDSPTLSKLERKLIRAKLHNDKIGKIVLAQDVKTSLIARLREYDCCQWGSNPYSVRPFNGVESRTSNGNS